MYSPNAIDVVWRTYCVTRDAFTITKMVISLGKPDLLRGTDFLESAHDVVPQMITMSRDAASDHAILSMWAVFERTLFSTLEVESRKLLIEPVSPFTIEVQQKVEDSIEYWKIGEVLDLYKVLVPADLIGQAKQVKRYRDWVAHKNPKKPSPAKITAELAYDVLAGMLQQLDFAIPESSDN